MEFIWTFVGLLALIMAAIRLFPNTDFARILNHQCVEELLRLLSYADRKHILYFFIAFGLIQSFGTAALADLAMVAAWDIALYVDAAIAVWTASMLARGRGYAHAIKFQLMRPFRRSGKRGKRAYRTHVRPSRTAANDDDPHPAIWGLAA